MTKLRLQVTSQKQTAVAQWLVDSLSELGSTSESATDAFWRQSGQKNTHEGRVIKQRHREHFDDAIDTRAAPFKAQSPREVLGLLSSDFGLNWIDIARLLGVSVPALRKWRKDENGASSENRQKLAALTGFLSLFRELDLGEPAAWLSMPFHADYTLKPIDVYSATSAPALIALLVNGGDFAELASRLDPDWRVRWARNYQVVELDNGESALVTRDSLSTMPEA